MTDFFLFSHFTEFSCLIPWQDFQYNFKITKAHILVLLQISGGKHKYFIIKDDVSYKIKLRDFSSIVILLGIIIITEWLLKIVEWCIHISVIY